MAGLFLCVLIACGAPRARAIRVDFFPGPIDRELQAASYDAVVRVFERHGARILRTQPGWQVDAFVGIECSGQRLAARLWYRRSDGEQSIAVRVCRAEFAAPGMCPDDAAEACPPGRCRERLDELLSSVERDLAGHLLAQTDVPTYHAPWWSDLSLSSLLSLITLRRWLAPPDRAWSAARTLP